jgi:hypothetical protein
VFSFARITQLRLAAAPVKAPDELAALGLDRRLARQNHLISGRRKTSDMNLLNHKSC